MKGTEGNWKERRMMGRELNVPAGWVLWLALAIIMTGLPLAAGERRGAMVEVTLIDGRLVKGELLAVKADALLIYEEGSGKGERLDLRQVAQVKLFKKTKFLKGLIIGFGAGLGISLYFSGKAVPHERGYIFSLAMFMLTPLTSLGGGLLGGLAGLHEKFSLAGTAPRSVQQNLERLKCHAREQDNAELALPVSVQGSASPSGFWQRFRLLWSPGVPNIPRSSVTSTQEGIFRFVDGIPSKDTAVYAWTPVSSFYGLHDHLKFNRLLLEYEWTPHLSPSLEFATLGELSIVTNSTLNFYSSDYDGRFESPYPLSYYCPINSFLLGLNWKPVAPFFARKHIVELGVAAGLALPRLLNSRGRYELASPQKMSWSCQVHAAYDFFYTSHFSLGVFYEYRYLRPSFPPALVNETRGFWPEGESSHNHAATFYRPTAYTMPGFRMNLDSMTYGFRIGWRF
jgi:hypothetical protein